MRRFNPLISHAPRRGGTTLLELIAASTVLTVSLVPALGLMRDSLRGSRSLETRECLVTVAMGTLEAESQLMARTWTARHTVLSAPGSECGYPSVLVDVLASDRATDGGIPGRLAVVRTTAFEDVNGNGRLDNNETKVEFVTLVGRFTSYDFEGRGA